MSGSVWKERAGASHRQAILWLTRFSSPSSLVAQVHQLQKLTAQTSSRAAQTSTCVLVPSRCSLRPLSHLCCPPHFHLIPALPSPVLQTVIISWTLYSPCLPPLLSPKPKCALALFRFFFFHWLSSSCPASAPFRANQKLGLRVISFMEVRDKEGHSSPKDEPGNYSPKQSKSRRVLGQSPTHTNELPLHFLLSDFQKYLDSRGHDRKLGEPSAKVQTGGAT